MPAQERAISIKGLTAGMGFTLAPCCHPVPGDRIVGLRKPGEGVEVHAIDCLRLANGVDADWVDLCWGERSTGAIGRLQRGALPSPRHAGRHGRDFRPEPRQRDQSRADPAATTRSTLTKSISRSTTSPT